MTSWNNVGIHSVSARAALSDRTSPGNVEGTCLFARSDLQARGPRGPGAQTPGTDRPRRPAAPAVAYLRSYQRFRRNPTQWRR